MRYLKQLWQWIDDRTGITELLKPMLDHPVPEDARWMYVFGSATLFCFILQVITGVGLAFLYQPSSENAYESLKFITYQVPMGSILRGIHSWGASAMILLVGIHMIRVYIMAAFKYPREMSWITGLVLLLLTILMGFTGQLLRWDSNGVWSAIVGAEQAGRVPLFGKEMARILLGGETLGGATLSRFFAIHVFLVPAFLFALIGLHLYLVIRNGISEPPKIDQPVKPETYREWYKDMLKRKGVPFWPNAAWRDLTFGIIVILCIFFLAVFVGPPEIGDPPNPTNINANPRPDWYFLWLFSMFALMPRQIESYAIALAPVIAAVILILVPLVFNKGERSPLRRPWSIGVVALVVIMVITFWYIGVKSPWSPTFDTKKLSPEIIGNLNEEAKNGSDLFYKKACIYCHAISGTGGDRGPDLTLVGNRLSEENITIKIVNGGGNMPAFGSTLKSKELNDLVKFLKTRTH